METQTIKELLEDPQQVAEEMAAFRRSARRLSRKPRLIDRYPDRWIALFAGKVCAEGDSFKEVVAQSEAQGIDRGRLLVRFISREPRTMIL